MRLCDLYRLSWEEFNHTRAHQAGQYLTLAGSAAADVALRQSSTLNPNRESGFNAPYGVLRTYIWHISILFHFPIQGYKSFFSLIFSRPLSIKRTMSSPPPTPLLVDIHTHIYPPSYISLLSARSTVPYIHRPADNDNDETADARLIILPSDDEPSKPRHQRGRPLDRSYSSLAAKRAFMARHGIAISVISLANPWLDFLVDDLATSAPRIAADLNDELDRECAAFNDHDRTLVGSPSGQKLYAFATLPVTAAVPAVVAEIHRVRALRHVRGVILSTAGLRGAGLADARMDAVWDALSETQTLVFLHPHYGLPDAAYYGTGTGTAAGSDSGHVLPLALGFPLETTIALTRLYLAGTFDRFPELRLLLAHAGGALPFLAGRVDSCVRHERAFAPCTPGGQRSGPARSIWDVLRSNVYLDAVVYATPALKAAVDAAGGDRVLFGTDHPFFPPIGDDDGQGKWESVQMNVRAIERAFGDGGDGHGLATASAILGGNAVRILGLDLD